MFKYRYILYACEIIAVGLIFHNEFLTYWLLPWQWASHVKCSSANCVKLLLIADPQILGEQDSSAIAKWDSDRYLLKTFNYAFSYTQPDIVIFLGDVMDEGHISSDRQFESDLERFQSIFSISQDINILTMFLPGDNDIGGEGDPILPQIVHRFDKAFQEAIEPVTYQNLEFYKINQMTLMFQEPEALSDGTIRVALTHMPILRKIHTLSKQIATTIQPHVIFSGHDHMAMHLSAPMDDVWRKEAKNIEPSANWMHYALDPKLVQEIIVPTCSYRMGSKNMGYGFAIIDQTTNTLSFSILWLPPRLGQLAAYLIFLIILSVFALVYGIAVVHRRIRRITRSLYAKTFRPRFQKIIP